MNVYEKLAKSEDALTKSRKKNNMEWADKYEEDIAKY